MKNTLKVVSDSRKERQIPARDAGIMPHATCRIRTQNEYVVLVRRSPVANTRVCGARVRTVKRATAYFFRSPRRPAACPMLHAPACCLVPCLPVHVCLLLLFGHVLQGVCKPKAADSNCYVRVPLVQDILSHTSGPGGRPKEKILWGLPVCKYCYVPIRLRLRTR